jgi:carboxymethylenebutenolidase
MMDKKLIDLFEDYEHEALDRRDFFKKLSILAGSTAAAYALLPMLENNYAEAEVVPKDDPGLITDTVTYPGKTGDIKAYFARPKGDVKRPGVIVIHEIWGLNPHIEDVARRVAKAGFLAIAPDALSLHGGSPQDSGKAVSLMRQLDWPSTTGDFVAAITYLKTQSLSTGKVGAVGFCWGGGMANAIAVQSSELNAAVPFYGRVPEAKDVPNIRAALCLQYAGLDQRINAGIPGFLEALMKSSIEFQLNMYPNVNHAFHNDTGPRYDKKAAQLAWKRTIDFFNEMLL